MPDDEKSLDDLAGLLDANPAEAGSDEADDASGADNSAETEVEGEPEAEGGDAEAKKALTETPPKARAKRKPKQAPKQRNLSSPSTSTARQ
jgi:hypothetical protein